MRTSCRFFLFAVASILWTNSVMAQGASVCGDPPPVANETLKADISGKAQLLSKYVGNAELGGQIQTSRTEIFSKYPDAERSRSNAYFEYQVCVLIMSDKTRSNEEKLHDLEDVRRDFNKPVTKVFNVSIQSGEAFIDNRKFGPVNGLHSTIDIKIDGESIIDGYWHLYKPLGTHLLKLNEGEHTYEFDARIFASGAYIKLVDSCSGTFVVDQSGTYEPFIAIEAQGDTGGITECSIKRRA